jgi:hypothetical protein
MQISLSVKIYTVLFQKIKSDFFSLSISTKTHVASNPF